MRTEQLVDPVTASATLPRLDSSLTACVRWRYADLADVLRAQVAILELEQQGKPDNGTDAPPAN